MTERIVVDPKILAGKAVVKGTRIPVYLILNLLAHGETLTEITKDYPELTKDDIKSAIEYAAKRMQYEETIPMAADR
jgi:uncharacterized protein (DUF433 family)